MNCFSTLTLIVTRITTYNLGNKFINIFNYFKEVWSLNFPKGSNAPRALEPQGTTSFFHAIATPLAPLEFSTGLRNVFHAEKLQIIELRTSRADAAQVRFYKRDIAFRAYYYTTRRAYTLSVTIVRFSE